MYTIDRLKEQIDLHELAGRLGWRRKGTTGNYHSPKHEDKNPSVSIFADGKRFKDHSTNKSGSCIDMVAYHFDIDFGEATEWLRREYGMPAPEQVPEPDFQEKSLAEYIAHQCLKDPSPAIKYLVEHRGFNEEFAKAALKHKTIGWNTYTNNKKNPKEFGYGGPGLATIVRNPHTGKVLAVDTRYQDPELNGGVKTNSQGEKANAPWMLNPHALKSAYKVVMVESAINALCVEAMGKKGVVGLAMRGTQTVKNFDPRLLIGKQVVICGDCDPVKDGHVPGDEFMTELYDLITAHGIPVALVNHGVDLGKWEEGEDLNDILIKRGIGAVQNSLDNHQTWLIPGQARNGNRGKPRVYIPHYDQIAYSEFEVLQDFTRIVTEKEDSEGNFYRKYLDVCAFRIASLSKLNIQSERATLNGDIDNSPTAQFSAFIQGPEDRKNLVRKVMTREQLHSVDAWKKVGKIFAPNKFLRALSIWGRASSLNEIDAVNFVGLCFKAGKPFVSEGKDCYFRNPEQQCNYSNLSFRRGSANDARAVVENFARTYNGNQALHMLVWAIGCHLKCYTEFWPHFVLQGDKGTGKSTLALILGRAIDMDVFGGQTVATTFRQVITTSYSSHPVAWEEISEAGVKAMKSAQSLLQDLYRWNTSKRTSESLTMLHCTPVMLVGESMDMETIHGKTVRTYLDLKKRNAQIPDNQPKFPMRNWLDFLASLSREQIREAYDAAFGFLDSQFQQRNDSGAQRMVHNYACMGMAWFLLCHFLGLPQDAFDYMHWLAATMNDHIKETGDRRDPWTWVVEAVVSDIDRGEYRYPHMVEVVDGQTCLIVRINHMMHHVESTSGRTGLWDRLPVKSPRVIKKQIASSGVLIKDGVDRKFRTPDGRTARHGHMQALSVHELEKYGIYVAVGDERAPVDADATETKRSHPTKTQ